ncbi:MAG: hypothetical protein HGB11_03855, partial [Chlorobiales bacterium]|nr:hypothetical protein [Chlorobiales bacterium]
MIKTLTRRSFLKNILLAVVTVALTFGIGACGGDSGTNGGSSNGSVSGTLTFTYKGESITSHSDKWPHSGVETDNFPSGWFRVGLIPSYSTGVPATGPTKVLPAGTTTGSGMTYGQLTNGTYPYQFDKIGKGSYIVAPTYENINDDGSGRNPSFREVVATGFYSNALAGFGSLINLNDDPHPNIDIYCDIAIGEYAYTTMKSVKNGGNVGAIIGGVKLNNPANWP